MFLTTFFFLFVLEAGLNVKIHAMKTGKDEVVAIRVSQQLL